ncbi:hypothetical protein EYC84_011678 [Monilinia fructicola]|uniref:Uncharacterized protein n=1 Tax=Monilinia fructicola TaxID=38448 RepID=A0A5M9J7Q6_MONFR|nr:hypothetical protein EYC84_011678 [Monilinia fructicola]
MILIEGLMLVPPERGTIIGRALWKTRYVVLGTGAHLHTQTDILEKSNSKKGKSIKPTLSKPSLADLGKSSEDGLFISIYKAKGDWEYIAQHPISAFKSCEIHSISEKQRKRRSSRTGGLTSNKDAQWADTLLFRSVPEDRNNIYDWQITIKPRLQQVDDVEETPMSPMSPMSPLSPIFTSFTNPFSPREPRPSSQNGKQEPQPRLPLQSINQYAQTQRERPSALISPSPSIRSHRSDLSSQASSSHPPMAFTSTHSQNYNNTTLPNDLPSPVSVSGYDNFIEGWTSAQGRSSALSHHTRGSNSIASAIGPSLPSASTTSPGPRETILDRAFQMRCIPGSERLQDKDEEKISSIARFEAIMRENDARVLQRSATSATDSYGKYKPGWELEEESEESDNEDPGLRFSEQLDSHDVLMPTPAQRALDYIAGRQTQTSSSNSRPISPTSPIPFMNRDAMNALHSGSSSTNQSFSSTTNGLRPRTGTTSTHMRRNSRPSSLALPPRSISTTAVPTSKDGGSGGSGNTGPISSKAERDDRRSSISTKRLSFHEFARRLSSTSSLLLVQTNASSNSGRGDSFKERDDSRRGSVSDYGLESSVEFTEGVFEERRGLRSSSNGLSLRGGDGQTLERDMSKRCAGGFRQMGVFGGEGGFL